jgi:hypothetical protein
MERSKYIWEWQLSSILQIYENTDGGSGSGCSNNIDSAATAADDLVVGVEMRYLIRTVHNLMTSANSRCPEDMLIVTLICYLEF